MAGMKDFRVAVLNHVHGKHITCSIDAADPLRNAFLTAIATIFREHGRIRDADQCERFISKVIVSRGEGPEVVPVRTTVDEVMP